MIPETSHDVILHIHFLQFVLIIVFCAVRLVFVFATEKTGFHSDELWGYGSANGYYEPFIYGEDDVLLNKKVKKAFEHGITPIVCCGETLTQREQGVTIDFIRQQIKIAFLDVTADQAKTAVIAYEPIWAIGTGKVATTEQAQEVCAAIRACIGEIYDEATAEAIRIQYGGSVSAASAPELFAQPDIDGGLVGGASLKADFGKIVNY